MGWTTRQRPAAERFWEKVEKTDTCWIWTGVQDRNRYCSYGRFYPHRSHQVLAHRWAYEAEVGPVPTGLELDHICRNQLCVRPDHLEPVTHAENMRRSRREVCPQGHSMEDAYVWVTPKGYEHRTCRPCNREHHRRSAA